MFSAWYFLWNECGSCPSSGIFFYATPIYQNKFFSPYTEGCISQTSEKLVWFSGLILFWRPEIYSWLCTQGWLLLVVLRGSSGMSGIEPWLTTHKANTLPIILSHYPQLGWLGASYGWCGAAWSHGPCHLNSSQRNDRMKMPPPFPSPFSPHWVFSVIMTFFFKPISSRVVQLNMIPSGV